MRLATVLSGCACSAAAVAAPATPEQAVERQRDEVREVVAGRPCRAGTADEIVVCARPFQPSTAPPSSGYDPTREFAAPERGPWFEFRRGSLSVSCCGISTMHGAGAGLSLRIRF